MEIDKKRKRGPSFSRDETNCLLSIIDKYKNVIENKKTNAVCNDDKAKAWKNVCRLFNSECPNSYYRDEKCLKKHFNNCKRQLRTDAAEERKYIYKTGGGPAPPDGGGRDDLLKSIVNEKTVIGLSNPFDCDGVVTEYVDENKGIEETNTDYANVSRVETPGKILQDISFVLNDEEDGYEIDQSETIAIPSWKKLRADDLNSPLTKNLQNQKTSTSSSRRRPVIIKPLTSSFLAEKYDKLIDHRLEIAKMEQTLLAHQTQWQKEKSQLEKESLLLDIKMKEAALERNNILM